MDLPVPAEPFPRLNTRDEIELRAGFPRTAEDLFGYHAVILDDVESAYFGPDQAAVLQRFVSERGLTLPVLKDPGGRVAAREYRTTGYPETFVLDREGRLLQHVVGPAEWDSAEKLAHFRSLLEGVPAR